MSTANNESHDVSGSGEHEVDLKKPLFLRKPALRNLLIITFSTIALFGIRSIFSAFPYPVFPAFSLHLFVALCLICLKFFSMYERQFSQISGARAEQEKAEKELKNARRDLQKTILFLLYMDRTLRDKAHTGDTALTDYPYDTPCTKDIALGLILEHMRELNTAKEIARDELSRAFSILKEQGEFYTLLRKLDDLIMQHVPETIKSLHEKAVFSLRFNLLALVLDASEKNEYFTFEYNADNDYYYVESTGGRSRKRTKYRWEETPIIHFFIMVLNEFYANDPDYEEQCHEFEIKAFRDYYSTEEATGTLMKSDLQGSIRNYEKAIAELQEDIADLRVQAHDLQILLDVFYAEYNSRVGILYAKLDRIKLKIKEYRKRLKLAAGKSMTEEEAEKIDEKIDELFSRAREKVNDLEDETRESSDEYGRYVEEEEQQERYGEDFLDEIKRLFRKLVHKFHPDMADNEAQKKEFHNIFIRIKEAYDNRNIDLLHELETKMDLEEERAHETPEEQLERLRNEHEKLKEIHKHLKTKLDSLQRSELNRLRERVAEERNEGRDLLQDLMNAVDEEIRVRQSELDELIEQYEALIAETV